MRRDHRVSAACFLVLLWAGSISSQVLHKEFYRLDVEPPVPRLASNSVSDLLVDGTTLWAGTGGGLSKSSDDGLSWESYGVRQGLGRGGVSALTKRGDTIWVATAFDSLTEAAGLLPTGSGLSYSTDGGKTWTHVDQPGVTPVQNVTFDIAIQDGTVWITSWGGGLRKSVDMGRTWQQVILDDSPLNPSDPKGHVSFSILIFDGQIWVGTAAGIYKSIDGGRTWTLFSHQNQDQPISGNFIVALARQRYRDHDVTWAATVETTDPNEFRAVSKTEDGGFTWTTTLRGEFAHNFAFDDSVVYVVTDNGLFKSIDGGETWAVFPQPVDPETGERFYTTEYFTAAYDSVRNLLWTGGADGLARTADNGLTWKIFRAFQPTGQAGSPKTYAYPNPFSPLRHNLIGGDGHVRFQYHVPRPTRVTVKVYDFAMELVKTVVAGKPRPAGDFAEVWDGKNEVGHEVANGVYFYSVEVEGEGTFWGKVIVLD